MDPLGPTTPDPLIPPSMNRTRFVAEASSNHGTDLARSLAFVDVAAELGCSAVKFQQFRIHELFAPEALRAAPHLLERVAWELPEGFNADLAARAREQGLAFSSTPFYLDAVGVLEPHVDFFKLASYQILWDDVLREVGRTGKPVVLATGMATLREVLRAVAVLRESGAREIEVLHCVSLYPTPAGEANLRAIDTLRSELGGPVGWSDHTVDPRVVRRAVTRFDASMVEFHLDLDGDGAEYAGGHCWLPDRIGPLIAELNGPARRTEEYTGADGDGVKEPRVLEAEERRWRTDPVDGLRPLVETRHGLEVSVA